MRDEGLSWRPGAAIDKTFLSGCTFRNFLVNPIPSANGSAYILDECPEATRRRQSHESFAGRGERRFGSGARLFHAVDILHQTGAVPARNVDDRVTSAEDGSEQLK